jgi:hypothetical protein
MTFISQEHVIISESAKQKTQKNDLVFDYKDKEVGTVGKGYIVYSPENSTFPEGALSSEVIFIMDEHTHAYQEDGLIYYVTPVKNVVGFKGEEDAS